MKNTLSSTIKMAGTIGRSAWLQPRPFLLYFKPTARCDLRCNICDRWKEQSKSEDELNLDEIHELLTKFRRAGAAVLTMWGGEPTLRKDLPEILEMAKKMGYRTSMCTNCNSLAKKADRVLPNLDTLLCSLDGYKEAHDEARGVKGLYDRVVEAIKVAREYKHCRVKIWATIHNNNLGQQKQLAQLAKELGVGIEFFPISAIEGYNNDTVPSPESLIEIFDEVKEFKKNGYPVWNPDRVLEQMRTSAEFSCNFSRIAIHTDHTGLVYSCEDPAGTPRHIWGNYKNIDPIELYKSDEYQKVMKELSECNCCRLPCVMELSDNLPLALSGMFMQSFSR